GACAPHGDAARKSRLPTPVQAGSGSRVCAHAHSQHHRVLPCQLDDHHESSPPAAPSGPGGAQVTRVADAQRRERIAWSTAVAVCARASAAGQRTPLSPTLARSAFAAPTLSPARKAGPRGPETRAALAAGAA